MTGLPKKWNKSEKSIRAIQLAFEFSRTVSESIREEAAHNGLSPSDQIRAIIGLSAKKPKRPRLTVSLSEIDYEQLAERYGLPPGNRPGIREAIANEIISYSEILCANRGNDN